MSNDEELRLERLAHAEDKRQLKEQIKNVQQAKKDQTRAYDEQVTKLARTNQRQAKQLAMKTAALELCVRALREAERALLHRTCPACNNYPCEGSHVDCQPALYAAHRNKTIEQLAQEQAAKNSA